ncbi:lipoyl(octanoyl) transferase LipB [Anthocerotibacter panamensis]|uniref:lipoyl(octanoyl) transferase LipB n=1 Tax=Anthocerotibacter panamensis TaxID=2857077 RepID=UPI001FD9D19F|nr:lipoyl(octanoyl) transferase LipB [Anthocerotibacter panamensis]
MGALRPCLLYTPGQVPYPLAWEWQRHVQQQKIQDPEHPDVLFLLEHPPVYTLGQGSSMDFVRFASGAHELHRTERGGEVTYHGPGQIVGYPILDLRHYRQDLHWYLRQLEEVVIQTLAALGISGERIAGLTGVWVEGAKVAAIGIKVSRWVTLHGFAFNVTTDLAPFAAIVPCGLTKPVTSLAQLCPGATLEAVQPLIAGMFCKVFGVKLIAKKLDYPILGPPA